jgi:pSer/pThr/pTyr-binding forkhead associated (FHA) protein
MIISVIRENNLVTTIDLGVEVQGAPSGELVFMIGRAADCHVRLDDHQVSRYHAQLVYRSGEWIIRQESGFSPLTVNGAMTAEKLLSNGDLITIAQFVLSIAGIKSQTQEIEARDTITETGLENETESDPLETRTLFDAEAQNVQPEQVSEEETREIDFAATEEPIAPEQAIEEDVPVLAEGFGESDFESDEDSDLDGTGEFDTDENNDIGEKTEFSSAGALNSEFSGENEETLFPEDNDAIVDEFGSYDDDEMGSADDESTRVIQAFAKFQLEIFGEYAPYDKYNIEKNEIVIGRDPTRCDIVLSDPEVSSLHAKVIKSNASCSLEDLQSGNGTLLNGERINKSPLSNEDEFIIGSTTFTLKIVSDFLSEEQDRLMPVEDNQFVEVEEVVEVESAFDEETSADLSGGETFGEGATPKNQSLVDKFKALPPKKKIIYGAIGFMLLLMLLPEGEETGPQAPQVPSQSTAQVSDPDKEKPEVNLTPEQLEFIESSYQLANEHIQRGLFDEALREIDNNVLRLIDEYKNAGQLRSLALRGIEERERIEAERRRRIQEEERRARVAELVERARKAVQEKNVEVAERLFADIALLDPNNFDVSAMKIEIDAWKKEQERKALQEAQKRAERERMVAKLQPGKTFYLRKEWFNATVRLTEFLLEENMDEDLIKEATQMLQESKNNLNAVVGPLLGRARSLREGQDLKGAYESYNSILTHEPTNAEALNEMNEIREVLHARSRRVYREAIISESLSLFQDAKEKFQEVQQISPSDSEYYIKATSKLQDYID